MRAPHGSGCGCWSMVDRVHGPGKGRRTTWCRLGGHAAATRADERTAPIHPSGSDGGGGGTQPARTGGSSRPGGRGARRHGATRRRRKAASGRRRGAAATDDERRRTASDGGATPNGKAAALRGRGERRRGDAHRGSPSTGRRRMAMRNDREMTVNGGRMARTTANATASMARLGAAASGDQSSGGGGGEEGDGARARPTWPGRRGSKGAAAVAGRGGVGWRLGEDPTGGLHLSATSG
uniref:Uncharacterized protein n=2 Tax=Oryza sativa subsp. japonica TaxID=39947 RepID=Q69IW2_ORYSJ|nr:hypothetical protein [Oryza sativa Japonica Group]BAD32089.1 hypothetical protein [Oryza sativa Japonica Group]